MNVIHIKMPIDLNGLANDLTDVAVSRCQPDAFFQTDALAGSDIVIRFLTLGRSCIRTYQS